ncbi:LacI family DNA-binding transcriptional regulator [Streptomyces sp. NPDC001508]|uniref:LacI family DNA-binding transcriptional regulator n=1 Tax=Streptomyces sp. NPDC001508 TaxID=3154656 RepID=UPI003321F3F1
MPHRPTETSDHQGPNRPATSADVGRLAGVSRSTVSLVLNEVPGQSIPEATRERVRQAAKRLGYVPHRQAATLRRGRSSTVLIPSPPGRLGTLVARWIDDVEAALEANGFSVMLYGDRYTSGEDAVRRWLSMRPLAVLTLGGADFPDASIAALRRGGVQAVIMTDAGPREGAHIFRFDHVAVGALAVSHLIERGRRRIGVLVPQEPLLQTLAERRYSATARFSADVHFERIGADLTQDSAAAVADTIVKKELDGVVAFNDDYAMLTLAGLLDRGIPVPSQVAIVGADDQPVSAFARPSITSIRLTLPAPENVLSILRSVGADPDRNDSSFHELPAPLIVPRTSA